MNLIKKYWWVLAGLFLAYWYIVGRATGSFSLFGYRAPTVDYSKPPA